jgi:hypothetical protein
MGGTPVPLAEKATLPADLTYPRNWFNHRWVLIASLLAFALVLNREGDRLPTGNEFVYLLYFYHAWHPHFLPGDWTFTEGTAGHAIFNLTTGWMTLRLSLEHAAWLGRLISWIATFIGLFQVGRHFKIPPIAVWAGIVLWLLERQSLVTGDWMIGTFEAKVIAYPCLLFAVDAVLSGNPLLAGVLAGAAFSYHTAVGMWGGAALGMAVLLSYPWRKTVEFSLAAIVFALPGVIASWNLVMGAHAISPAEARYLTTISLPDCFDPARWSLTSIVVLLLLPIFSLLHALRNNEDRQVRQILVFDLTGVLFFAFGLVARLLGRFDWVELFPMRVYATFALLLFFWRFISVLIATARSRALPGVAAVVGTILLLCLPSPILQLRDMLYSHVEKLLPHHGATEIPAKGNDADFIAAARWVAGNVPATDTVIAPPWRNDGYYYIRHPLVANWHAPRYDALTEWKARIEAMVGDTSDLAYEDQVLGEMNPRAWRYYAGLSEAQITDLRRRYGGDWLITAGHYAYPVAFQNDTYFVYRLPPAPKPK